MKSGTIILLWSNCLMVGQMEGAITTFSSRAAFLSQDFAVTATEDFSTSTVGTLIGNTLATEFVSSPFTVSSSSALDAGPFRSSIADGSHPDNFDGSVFAFLETFGSSHENQELRNDTSTIRLSGEHQAFGFDLGSFAEQTSAIFHTNLGNTASITGMGSIGSQLFAGVLTSTAGEYFTRVDFLITGAPISSDGFGVDNLVAGTIPEPASGLMVASTLGILFLSRWRGNAVDRVS